MNTDPDTSSSELDKFMSDYFIPEAIPTAQGRLKALIEAETRKARLDELELVPFINDRFDVYRGRRRVELQESQERK